MLKLGGNMSKKAISLSGGLDSTILLYKLVHEFGAENVKALTFNYGQRHSIELEKAKLSCSKLGVDHKVIDIGFLGELVSPVCSLIKNSEINVPSIKEILGHPAPNTEVPYRNMIFCSLCLSFAQSVGADSVYLSLNHIDIYSYWDTSSAFVEAINNISSLNRMHQIQLITPFVDIGKVEEIAIGLKLGVPFEDTHTCYNPNEKGESCGKCGSCAERIKAFMRNNTVDPIKYSIDIDWEKYINEKKV